MALCVEHQLVQMLDLVFLLQTLHFRLLKDALIQKLCLTLQIVQLGVFLQFMF